MLDARVILRTAIDRPIAMRAALDPLDVALVTGDISNDGGPDSYELARVELDRLGLPLFVMPGNHDAREQMRGAFADIGEMQTSGLTDWATTVGDTFLIGLDTLVEGQGGGLLRDESMDLHGDALANAGTDPFVVALHHPPTTTGIRFMDVIGLEYAAALHAVLADAPNAVTLLAGHVHGVRHGQIKHHRMATAPTICSAFALDQRTDAPVMFFTPAGCAVVGTDRNGLWSAVPLDPADGPFLF